MKTLREAKIEVASKFLEELTIKLLRGKDEFLRTSKFNHELSAFLILSPVTIVDLLENEEVCQMEREHEMSLEEAYRSQS